MAYKKSIGYDITLGMDPTGGTTYTTLGTIVDKISAGKAKVNFGNTTLLSDLWETMEPADITPGEATFEVGYDPADTTGSYGLLATALTTRKLVTFQITVNYADGSTASHEAFSGYVAGLGREFEKKKLTVVPVTIQLSGDPHFAGT